jgi:uncharacterized protein YcbK (DUF882 family)
MLNVVQKPHGAVIARYIWVHNCKYHLFLQCMLTKKKRNAIVAFGLLFSMAILIVTIGLLTKKAAKAPAVLDNSCPNCETLFADDVKTQEAAYTNKEGITPQPDDAAIERLYKQNKLVKLENTPLYRIEKLTHSVPYVHPKVKSFMDDLAATYTRKCEALKLGKVSPLVVTSLTRSESDVKRLQKVNSNAIENSGHLKGKTLDISYRHFDNSKGAKQVFINTLLAMKKQDRCFAKYERNGCIHITVQ